MMLLKFSSPQMLTDLFDVPEDRTPWGCEYTQVLNQGLTPQRERATFEHYNNALEPREISEDTLTRFGLYLLAADNPSPHLYVGYAASNSPQPEGLLNRLKKTRCKITGSHVGPYNFPNNSIGGVNHGGIKWTNFAVTRHAFHRDRNTYDSLSDIRLVIGSIQGQVHQEKTALMAYVTCITRNSEDILGEACRTLWPGNRLVTVLNRRGFDFYVHQHHEFSNNFNKCERGEIELWKC